MKTFRELVESDLRRGMRLKLKVNDDIDPQIRMATPDGDYALAVTLLDGEQPRMAMLELIKDLFVWKQVMGFTMVSELGDPPALVAIGVSYKEVASCWSPIKPGPLSMGSYGPVYWLSKDHVDPLILGLLPKGSASIDKARVAELNAAFGPSGTFPLVHVPTMEIGGL